MLEQSALDAKYQERDRNHFTGRFDMSFVTKMGDIFNCNKT